MEVRGIEGLYAAQAAGEQVSQWIRIDQARISMFATITEDEQWIHVDPARARNTSFGGTVAHGYMTLGLLTAMWEECYCVSGFTTSLNYGLNRVRFPAPVPVGSEIRGRLTISSVKEVDGGAEVQTDVLVECDAQEKPACVAQTLIRFIV